jgi:Etoposide-induced protein 2.4 (EI24)
MSISPLQQIMIGIKSPIYSVRFFSRNKGMLLLGIVPHIVNLIIYFWIVRNIVIAKWVIPLFHSLAKRWDGTYFAQIFNPIFIETVVWIIGILLYGIFGTAFVNAIASPIYDIIAQSAYEKTSGKSIPKQTLMDFIDSIISEVTKAVVILCLFIISFFVQIFAPLVFFAGIWYLGWNNIDRTLLLMNIPLRKRLLFGFRNWGLCIGLGLWSYIPLIGALMAFSMAAAGAIVFAKHEVGNDKIT